MSEWNLVSLKEIVNNLDNKRVPLNSSQRELKESKPLYPYIGANNIMGYIDEYIFDEKILCVAEDGGSWGYNQKCAVLYNEKVWVNNHAHVITAKENLVLEYLMYYLNHTDLNLYINGATRGKLTKSSLESIQIPLPPLPQQQKIAKILDAADALRQNDKALIAKYDELTQSLFLDMFGDPVKNEKGWEKIDLGKLTKRIVVGHVGPTSDGYSKEGVPFLRTQNVRPNFINYKDIMYVKKEFHFKLRKSQIYSEDILISRVGVNRGMAAVVPSDLNEANCANVVIVGSSSYFNSLYISFFLNKSFGTKPEYGYSVGSAQGVVNTSIVKKWPVFKIPLDLQNQFAERVAVIEEQKSIVQKSLEKSESLFNSLLQKAFKGEL
jgi:type I restriction enzyme, S subunit